MGAEAKVGNGMRSGGDFVWAKGTFTGSYEYMIKTMAL
jgi:hypothetical protein